jgi:hypothetical protein
MNSWLKSLILKPGRYVLVDLLLIPLFELFNPKSKKIIIVCMPKTGSTYIYKKLSRYTGYPINSFWIHREIQEFHPLLKYRTHKNHICQAHTMGSHYTVDQLNSIQAKPVILYRNLFDLVISMRDFLHSDEYKAVIAKYGFAHTYGGVFDKTFYVLSKEEQYDFIIDFDIPAFIRFYTSWKKYQVRLNEKPIWISYEQFFSDKEKYFEMILKFYDLKVNKKKISEVLNLKEDTTRLNKGISRKKGGNELTSSQIKKIESIASKYPEYMDDLLG